MLWHVSVHAMYRYVTVYIPGSVVILWLHLNYQELAEPVFDNEYYLILAITQSVYNRGEQGDFSVERYRKCESQ